MAELTGVLILVFALYMIAMLAIGYVASRRAQSQEDFFLADRSLKAWVTAISSTASSESAWAVLGTVGLAYKQGLSSIWFLPGCLMGYLINWLFLAEKLRRHSKEKQALTLPDYLESFFDDPKRLIRKVSSVIIFTCMMAYVAAQFTAIGKTFDSIFNVPHHWSIPVGGSLVLIYTMMGGFLAVAWTDFVQGLIMVLSLVLLTTVCIVELGGVSQSIDQVRAVSPTSLLWMGGKSLPVFLGSAVGLLGIGLGYPGQPHVLNRYMAAKDEKVIEKGIWIAMAWGILMYSSAIALGIMGVALFPDLSDPEHLFPQAALSLLHPFLTAIVLTGVLAAIMSTVSAQIIVAASTVAHDVYFKIMQKDLSPKKAILISRMTILILGLGAIGISLNQTQLIFWFVLFAWSGLGASFGPLILFTLYSKKVTREGALSGMLVGFGVTLFWKLSGLSVWIYELVPAFILASLSIYIVSRLTAR